MISVAFRARESKIGAEKIFKMEENSSSNAQAGSSASALKVT